MNCVEPPQLPAQVFDKTVAPKSEPSTRPMGGKSFRFDVDLEDLRDGNLIAERRNDEQSPLSEVLRRLNVKQ
jgi:hypothetical protein